MARILLLNGPNLNLLGTREPDIYGRDSLQTIETKLKALAGDRGHDLVAVQSNAEHELIAAIQASKQQDTAFVIINPGALHAHQHRACATPFSGSACRSSRFT
jgi:3-dehydroquinate dehydratase-2